MRHSVIKNYRDITYVQIGRCFVRKSAIELVNAETLGVITFRTTSGTEFSMSEDKAEQILSELCFNE